jgi:hypothetical protein
VMRHGNAPAAIILSHRVSSAPTAEHSASAEHPVDLPSGHGGSRRFSSVARAGSAQSSHQVVTSSGRIRPASKSCRTTAVMVHARCGRGDTCLQQQTITRLSNHTSTRTTPKM